jgi:hypothetical protein
MKKYVFTIKDDICAANGKDIEASELIAKMRLWGDVEDYDKAVASVCAEYQATIDNLSTQNAALKLHEFTDDEIALNNAYRSCKKVISDKYEARIESLEHQAEKDRVDFLKKAEQISALLAR